MYFLFDNEGKLGGGPFENELKENLLCKDGLET